MRNFRTALRRRSNDAYGWSAHYSVDRSYISDGLNQLTSAGSDDPVGCACHRVPRTRRMLAYEGSTLTDRRFLMADERGSVVSVTDSAGATIAINAYDEYGIPAPTNVGRFGYTGQIWLPELKLWYYKARIYSPTLWRFLQTDPIGYGDGINWYAYVGGDPVNGVDPGGMCATNSDGKKVGICGTDEKSSALVEQQLNDLASEMAQTEQLAVATGNRADVTYDPDLGPGDAK